jgi:hypothetical protein
VRWHDEQHEHVTKDGADRRCALEQAGQTHHRRRPVAGDVAWQALNDADQFYAWLRHRESLVATRLDTTANVPTEQTANDQPHGWATAAGDKMQLNLTENRRPAGQR